MLRFFLALGGASACAAFENMNGEYVISKTAKGGDEPFNTKWNEYKNEAGGAEYFEVYMGPITHTYGQVWWTNLPEEPLPDHLVERFTGKAMAIIGYEVDQVRKGVGPNGEDVSVPINMAYNHHHDAYFTGAGASMEHVPYDPADFTVGLMDRAHTDTVWRPVEHTKSPRGLPTSAHLAAGNGGEYRKSYHGFSSPVAYVVDEPRSIGVLPMQIDTWNRDKMNISGSPFVVGPMPKHSLGPHGTDALYSGLLECPLTDRVTKAVVGGDGFDPIYEPAIFECSAVPSGYAGDTALRWYWNGQENVATTHAFPLSSDFGAGDSTNGYIAEAGGAKTLPLKLWRRDQGMKGPRHFTTASAADEADAAKAGFTLLGLLGNVLTEAPAAPSGYAELILFYSAQRDDHFSSPDNCAQCGGNGYAKVRSQGWVRTGPAGAVPQTQCDHTIATAELCFEQARQMAGITGKVAVSQGASAALAPGCTISFNGSVASAFFNTERTNVCCGAGVKQLAGKATSLVGLEFGLTGDTATITLTGPADVWYGVGFFSQSMADTPYALIVDGKGVVTERKMANHAAGTQLHASVTVVRSTVARGRRTVVLTRAAKGATADHASFDMTTLQIPFIDAIGTGPELAYHANKTASVISLWPDQPACLCEQPAAPFGSAKGTIEYLPTGEQFGFTSYCMPEPRESILHDKNPTCDVRTYTGGLQVCKHMWTLLDADQGQPWADKPLVYYQKYRFYFQEYKPNYHVSSIPRQGWGIAAAGGNAEYDVPQCPKGTPVEECTHTIWGVLTPGGDNYHLSAIHFHCHAPTCLAMEIWNNQTGELLCREEPIYGGTGNIDLAKFDEPGYILQPPCLWGYEPGLEHPPLVSGVPFLIKAITNATYGHHGEMAFPEVTLIPWNTTTNFPGTGP